MEILDPERNLPARTEQSGMVEVAASRAAQEVQAAMVVAKKFPRDQTTAMARILQGCRRMTLAKESQYAYPRGGTRVSGPSIRLAEHILQNWGNCEAGVIDLERRGDESVIMAYAVDLETNHREVRVFTVPHVRERGEQKGGNVNLTDPRDVYEITSNQGARRKRACMLAIIPGDLIDQAMAECDKTLAGKTQEPLVDRVRKAIVEFSDLGVTQEMLEKRLGHKMEATTEAELVGLIKIYVSIHDEFSKREAWFDLPGAAPTDLQDGKQGFGFKKKAEPEKTTDTPLKDTPQRDTVQTAPAAGEPSTEGAPALTDDEALAKEARERELAEAAADRGGDDPAVKRASLLKDIDDQQNRRKMPARDRAAQWKIYCGTATRDQAPIEKLEQMRGDLRRLTGGGGQPNLM